MWQIFLCDWPARSLEVLDQHRFLIDQSSQKYFSNNNNKTQPPQNDHRVFIKCFWNIRFPIHFASFFECDVSQEFDFHRFHLPSKNYHKEDIFAGNLNLSLLKRIENSLNKACELSCRSILIYSIIQSWSMCSNMSQTNNYKVGVSDFIWAYKSA